MKKITLSMFVLILLSYFPAGAVELVSGRFDLEVESLKNSGTDYLESQDFMAQEGTLDTEQADKSIYQYKYRSPKKAFLYSLVIPGWGQKYAGSSIFKSIFFLAVEAGSWGGYFKYHGDGNDKTDQFKVYADLHWTEGDTTGADYGQTPPTYPNLQDETYRGWLLANYNLVDETEINEPGLTERLPDTKTQQYYEMIGKYDQFRGGWDDYWTGDTAAVYLTPNRAHYLDMRKDANDLLDKANTLLLVSMLNHLVSAFDAAISANRHNKKIADDTWSIKSEMRQYSATEQIPYITITHKF